jgi:probable phosphoglycerate mutase
VLLRHAETKWTLSGQHTGRTDLPLTRAGRQRARELAPLLASRRFAAVLVSPLKRARETCELAGLSAHARSDPRLMEWDYGEYEGLTSAEIDAERPGWDLWRDGCPGGEDTAAVGRRVDEVIEMLYEIDGDVAIFAHGHVLRVLGARWIELDPVCGARLLLSTGAMSVLGQEHGTRALTSWNALE